MAASFDFKGDLAIIIGDDFMHEFVWEDANCEPMPLTGDFYAQIKKAGVNITAFTCTITGTSNNIVRLEIASAVTSTLTPVQDASWDLEHHDPGITTVIRGKVDIEKGITEVP